jgi:hypothetical protein
MLLRTLPDLLQVVGFLSTALGTPDSYAFSKPQLAEFYVHHHFLHFTQHYHKLPASPASGSAVLCRSHLQVRQHKKLGLPSQIMVG